MVRARTCCLELNQIWREFRNDPGADRQGHEIGRAGIRLHEIPSPICHLI